MRKRNTESLREIIGQVLKNNHLDKKLNDKHLLDAWPKILGENIKQYTTELQIKNRVLYVTLSSSVLRHDLFLSREEIKNSLNCEVGAEVIKEIIFR
jgi:predicted nucleic acid-binding Zn ribbon protein